MYQGKRVILIVPAFNEKGKIETVVDKAKGTSIDEVCVVEDGSTDNTANVARARGATVLSHPERKGIGAAIRTGIKYALSRNFDVIVICAGNNKDNPQEIDRLLKPIVEDGYDYIHGSRYLKGGKWGNTPLHRIILSRVFSFLFSILVSHWFTDVTNGYRAFRAEVLRDKRINLDQEGLDRYELESYLQYKAITLGYRIKEVPVSKIYPTKQTTKMRILIDWWKMVKPIVLLRLRLKK